LKEVADDDDADDMETHPPTPDGARITNNTDEGAEADDDEEEEMLCSHPPTPDDVRITMSSLKIVARNSLFFRDPDSAFAAKGASTTTTRKRARVIHRTA
jgi:hypothetical protein